MPAFTLEELASQAEREGITLAEIIARTWSPADMDRAQQTLHSDMAENYSHIQDFMADVSVPGVPELSGLNESELLDIQQDLLFALSDDEDAEQEEA